MTYTHPRMTCERLKQLMRYDPETGGWECLQARPNRPLGPLKPCYSAGRQVFQVGGVQYLAHRLAWLYVHGRWPEQEIDHINGDPSDNRLHNLREVTSAINKQNLHRAKRNNSCQTLGVRPHRAKFQAMIRVDGKVTCLGTYPTTEEAHQVYLEAKRTMHVGCTI